MTFFSLNNCKKSIIRNVSNFAGWRTSRKIVVIESDDWGGIRMPSTEVFNKLTRSGLDVCGGDSGRYNENDSLESTDDLHALFDVLSSVIDSTGNYPVFTAVTIVANPDFEKIKADNFRRYYYEPFTETIKRCPRRDGGLQLWKEGISNKLFVPQFHGREHLNVAAWMNALQQNDKNTRLAFEHGFWGFYNDHPYNVSYQAAFDFTHPAELDDHRNVIIEGLHLFEAIFGMRASFFVPPNGPFNNSLEATAAIEGIRYMSAQKIQREPMGLGRVRRVAHYIGQRNCYGQLYLTRNCFFEPSDFSRDWVRSCLNDIEIAFRWRKPAVISTHRVNYIGVLNERNRSVGLAQLRLLLQSIKRRWFDVEFMSSDQLGSLIVECPDL